MCVSECQLEQLRERIHQSIKTLPRPKSYTWKSVLGCAVIGPDMLWYRGQLLEVLGGHVKVRKTHTHKNLSLRRLFINHINIQPPLTVNHHRQMYICHLEDC